MLMIRLQRIGRKNDPSFRMLVLEKTASPKAGTYTDLVGTYNPKTKAFTCNIEAIKGWMEKGAQLSPSLKNLLIDKGLIEGKKEAVIAKSKLEKNVAKRAAEEVAAKEREAAAKATEEATKAEEAQAQDEASAPAEAAPAEEPAPAA